MAEALQRDGAADVDPSRGRSSWSSRRSRAGWGGRFILAGNELTAADIMTVFSLTTMRLFKPCDLSP
jgi:hypothetical protein